MLECLYNHCFRHCFDFKPHVFRVPVSSNSPVNSRVSTSSNISRQSTQEFVDSTQEFVDSSFDIYEPEQQPFQLTSPARTRWIEAFHRVCEELNEVSHTYTVSRCFSSSPFFGSCHSSSSLLFCLAAICFQMLGFVPFCLLEGLLLFFLLLQVFFFFLSFLQIFILLAYLSVICTLTLILCAQF